VKKTVSLACVALCAGLFLGCPNTSSDGGSASVLGTWALSNSIVVQEGSSSETLSSVVFTLSSGHYALSYVGNAHGAGTQSGTISPSDPGPDVVITCSLVTGTGNAPSAPYVFYLKFSSVTGSSATIYSSSDNATWQNYGTATKS
jgi:hypothetical protein